MCLCVTTGYMKRKIQQHVLCYRNFDFLSLVSNSKYISVKNFIMRVLNYRTYKETNSHYLGLYFIYYACWVKWILYFQLEREIHFHGNYYVHVDRLEVEGWNMEISELNLKTHLLTNIFHLKFRHHVLCVGYLCRKSQFYQNPILNSNPFNIFTRFVQLSILCMHLTGLT